MRQSPDDSLAEYMDMAQRVSHIWTGLARVGLAMHATRTASG
jgi:hypothetical protein